MNDHIDRMRARMADPDRQVAAEGRARQVIKAIDVAALSQHVGRAFDEPRIERKVFQIYKAADVFGAATKGISPCHDGCNHCCYQPVLITAAEATLIANSSGRKMASPAFTSHANREYIGASCNFLKEGRCSIYDVRPFACRTYYSVDSDPESCRIVPSAPDLTAPILDSQALYEAFATVVQEHILSVADIRDWFPK